MSALSRKLLRDLWRLRAQVLTIALVMACGVAALVSMRSAYDSLIASCEGWYARSRFADVFAPVRRAPRAVARRAAALDGVDAVEARVLEDIALDMPGLAEPVVGRLVSLPRDEGESLGRVYVRSGRMPDPAHADEALVSEAFATAWGLRAGDTVTAVIQGRRQVVRVVGVGLSPEFVYVVQPGAIVPDDRRFGVLWMDAAAVESAFRMEGAFNDLRVRLSRGASRARVVAALDALLEPYGAVGAYGRERHPSARWVEQELGQLRGQATVTPAIFLGVAALLVNFVLSRLLGLEREQIATLKALGYDDGAIARHYLAWAVVTALLGAALGVALGVWTGRAFVAMYGDYFRFPVLAFRPSPATLVAAVGAGTVAAVAGAFQSVRKAVRVPPAEAMRPEAPARFAPTVLERMGVHRALPVAARMVLREVERRPGRLALSALGISFAAAIMVAGRFSLDALDVVIDLQFTRAQADDVTVSFLRPLPPRAALEVARLPGVLLAEPQRVDGVRMRAGPRVREAAILGLPADGTLRTLYDADGRRWALPPDGLVLGRALARRLGVGPGDVVTVEDLEGARAPKDVHVAALVDDLAGLMGYMDLAALHRLRGDGGRVTAVALRVDPARRDALLARLKRAPAVASASRRTAAIEYFRHETSRMSAAMSVVLAAFASIIAVGVVYNNARIALSVRSRELATLRVLGFTRAEVSSILFGEQAVQVALAIPAGLAIGRGLAAMVLTTIDDELFRMPLVISAQTYAFAALVVVAASVASAIIVRRRVDELDMVAVLKSRD
ncbi:MAG: FtsX-like permease family protein [Polyangiales bacterium]